MNQHHLSSNTQATLLMLSSCFCVALVSLFGKITEHHLGLPLALFSRFAAPAALMGLTLFVITRHTLNHKNLGLHMIRALFVVLSQTALFFYLQHSSVLNATLLYMTSPLFIPLILRLTYHTRIKKSQWASLLIGFIGVVLILKPNASLLTGYAFIGLLSGFFNALSQIAYYRVSQKSNPSSASFYLYVFSTLLVILPCLFFWISGSSITTNLHLNDPAMLLILLTSVAMISIGNQTCRGYAYRKAQQPSRLSPLMSSTLVFATLIDWLYFHHLPDMLSFVGAGLIVTSGILLTLMTNRSSSHETSLNHA
jgi:drug/metabolite transporter (DMT)-like permease